MSSNFNAVASGVAEQNCAALPFKQLHLHSKLHTQVDFSHSESSVAIEFAALVKDKFNVQAAWHITNTAKDMHKRIMWRASSMEVMLQLSDLFHLCIKKLTTSCFFQANVVANLKQSEKYRNNTCGGFFSV
jgi:hypothetical protein